MRAIVAIVASISFSVISLRPLADGQQHLDAAPVSSITVDRLIRSLRSLI